LNWSERAQAYRDAVEQREGPDLDRLAEWAEGSTVLDVATGGGHVARRLRDAGLQVVTCDPAPGMQPDVVCRAEDLPFADESFDVVVTRIAPHHFEDVPKAMGEFARVARRLVIVEDTLYTDERVEEAEKLRDPTHVRSYSEEEWRRFFEQARLEVEAVDHVEKRHPFDDWLARTGCVGAEAERVRELLAHRTDGDAWTDTKLLLKGAKR
jgi:ubiquinone/menaquinone biosynthesis C-methylase UbiE